MFIENRRRIQGSKQNEVEWIHKNSAGNSSKNRPDKTHGKYFHLTPNLQGKYFCLTPSQRREVKTSQILHQVSKSERSITKPGRPNSNEVLGIGDGKENWSYVFLPLKGVKYMMLVIMKLF